jgi:hypothetical protein
MCNQRADTHRWSARRLLMFCRAIQYFEMFVMMEGQYLNMYNLNTSPSDQELGTLSDKSLVEIVSTFRQVSLQF